MMEYLRTPDDRFQDLPGYDFAPNYLDIPTEDGTSLRVHHLDEGPSDGPVVLLLHGEPSWSYLYRHMIPVLVNGGARCIAPDLVGFGRSDKPTQQSDYSFEGHVAWLTSHVLDALELKDITMVGQDWGGMLGLRLVAAHPERFARVVVANTGLPDGTAPMTDAFLAWQNFAATAEDFPVGVIVNGGSATDLSPEVIAAYDAPFPSDEYKAGARVFPSLVPTSTESPSAKENGEALTTLRNFSKPVICAFSDADPITKNGFKVFLREIAGAQGRENITIEGGGHFLQEDRGPDLAAVVLDALREH